MANDLVVKSMTQYEVSLYDVVDDEPGEPRVTLKATATGVCAGMNRTKAREILRRATGENPRKGAVMKWKPVGRVKYGMPLRDFLASADLIEHEDKER